MDGREGSPPSSQAAYLGGRECGLRGAAVAGSGAGTAVAAAGDGEVVTTKALPPKFLRHTSLIPDLDRFGSADVTVEGRSLNSCTVVKGTPCESKIPYLNAPIYLQHKTQIGKVDEIFGHINEAYFSIKMLEGIITTSYSPGDKLYIDPAKQLPLTRFLRKPKYDNPSLFSFCSLLTTTLLSQHVNVAMISCMPKHAEGKKLPLEVDVVVDEEAAEVEAFVEELVLGMVEGVLQDVDMMVSEAVVVHIPYAF
ncbi:h ACA ribonucleoprotein complex subunit 1-like protein [Musa troglodytarum]|uniref:H/ACA ribonucleoprotein complex subunit n=1 Tax=Musa troglodytarum TaxID=320322 RepID=A0A9E7ECP4_9LILI|nr:h ACA ribonucleoprotein complex subunit 1-like protein [Musa troglodytarum]